MKSQKQKHYGLIPLILGCLLLLTGLCLTIQLPKGCQYLCIAQSGDALTEQISSLSSSVEGVAYAVAARSQGLTLSSEQSAETSATVYAVSEGYFDFHTEVLLEGRFISAEDIQEKKNSTVITEKTALQLFGGLDPLGQKLELNGQNCTVVGIIQSGLRIGETNEQILFVPVSMAEKLNPSVLELELPSLNEESRVQILAQLWQWSSEGRWLQEDQMRMKALLPLWLVGLILGVLLLRLILNTLVASASHARVHCQALLEWQSFQKIWPSVTGRGLLLLLGFAACTAALLLLLRYAALPLHIFPDWIPKRLTEGSEIVSTVKELFRESSSSVLLQSTRSVRADLCAGLNMWGSLFALCGTICRRCKASVHPENQKA